MFSFIFGSQSTDPNTETSNTSSSGIPHLSTTDHIKLYGDSFDKAITASNFDPYPTHYVVQTANFLNAPRGDFWHESAEAYARHLCFAEIGSRYMKRLQDMGTPFGFKLDDSARPGTLDLSHPFNFGELREIFETARKGIGGA